MADGRSLLQAAHQTSEKTPSRVEGGLFTSVGCAGPSPVTRRAEWDLASCSKRVPSLADSLGDHVSARAGSWVVPRMARPKTGWVFLFVEALW